MYRQWAASHTEVLQIYLYGSQARGDHKPDSDIDLAIMMRPDDGQDNADAVWMLWEEKDDPDLRLSHAVHLEWYEKDAELTRVGQGVEKDGILVYSFE